MITSVVGFRAFDVLEAFARLADSVIEAELLNAEQMLFGYVVDRGYGESLTQNVAVHRAIYKVARVELLGLRGQNLEDLGHATLIRERDLAVEWFKDIAKGTAKFVGAGAPARNQSGIIVGFPNGEEVEDRKW